MILWSEFKQIFIYLQYYIIIYFVTHVHTRIFHLPYYKTNNTLYNFKTINKITKHRSYSQIFFLIKKILTQNIVPDKILNNYSTTSLYQTCSESKKFLYLTVYGFTEVNRKSETILASTSRCPYLASLKKNVIQQLHGCQWHPSVTYSWTIAVTWLSMTFSSNIFLDSSSHMVVNETLQ